MKKFIAMIFAAALLLFSACGGPSTYDDCTVEQKTILNAASSISIEYCAAKGAQMNGDAVLVTASSGTTYEFVPIRFTEDGTERKETAMFESEWFTGFASEEIPLSVLLNPENLSASDADELLDKMECRALWLQYELYGTGMEGRSVGDGDILVKTVSVVKQKEVAPLFARWAQ